MQQTKKILISPVVAMPVPLFEKIFIDTGMVHCSLGDLTSIAFCHTFYPSLSNGLFNAGCWDLVIL